MVTVPTPYDATAGRKLTAAELDAGIREPLLFLMTGYPRVHAFDTSGASMVSGVSTLVPFNSEVFDTDGMHSTSSNTSRITFTTAGLYEVDYLLTIAPAAYTSLTLNIRLNATGNPALGTQLRDQPYADGARGSVAMNFRMQRFFNANDHVEIWCNQQSGGPNRALDTTQHGCRVLSRWLATA